MAKLSIVIPSRDEKFLVPTIDDIFSHATGEIEVVAVLDSDKWPENWAEVVKRHEPRLHTIHQGSPKGMRAAINAGAASAISRGATYIAKSDGHCSFSEGFDEVLKAEMDDDWIVVPRRLRLDPESWTIAEPDKPPYDYHYLSFPDDPNDFGGAGLNGKPWFERQKERVGILLDEEMSSQGSFWAMKADYFTRLELMDEASYGPFWNEAQELFLKCWLSGGRGMVNKKCWYAHLHKGSKYGRGYRLSESWLKQGRNHTMLWPWNEAWGGQTLPFEWLIDHFWPVPSWPENWRDILYAQRKPRAVGQGMEDVVRVGTVADGEATEVATIAASSGLRILSARYGILGSMPPFSDHFIDVADRVRSLVKNDSLDIIVNNSTLCPGQNPFRGKKKVLLLTYSYGDTDPVTVERVEKDWLIIGQAGVRAHQQQIKSPAELVRFAESNNMSQHAIEYAAQPVEIVELERAVEPVEVAATSNPPRTATALNDYLIRKFQISPQRLKAPMPIELNNFHRNDLAQLFAELGFKRGAEIGVAEGNYCLVPGTKILKTDLTWVNVESLSVGDVLIGFDEWIGVDSVRKYGTRAKMKPSVVKSAGRKILPSFLVTTDKGEVAASEDHQWIIRRKGRHQPTCRFWCKTSDLRIGDALSLYSRPWEVMDSYDAGYLAGFFDGEGSYHNQQGIMFAQNPGDTLEKVLSLLERHKFQTGPKNAAGVTCLSYRLKGRKAAMRFIGTVRPNRFLPTSQRLWLNASTDGSSCEPATIVEIKPIGEQEVIGVGTSTKTLIANGFLSHNSEVLLKANPEMERLLLIDPWHAYSDNPQNKTKEKHEYAYNETKRKVCQPGWHVTLDARYSMEAVQDIELESLDFCYIDGNHSFDFVMQDLIEWSKRVRSAGIVSGDDWYRLDPARWNDGGVVEAVQAYVNAHRIPIWYLFQGHKSVDFMWCKP